MIAKEYPFYLDEYIYNAAVNAQSEVIDIFSNNEERFKRLCKEVKTFFDEEWEEESLGSEGQGNKAQLLLERQRKAIIGYPREVRFFTDKIENYLRRWSMEDIWRPEWYDTLANAIFHEIWGLAGLYPWTRMEASQSAKVIGERIFFMTNGKQVLQRQRITLDRHRQLRKALLLNTPKARMDDGYIEVYMLDGTRITIYDEKKTIDGLPCIIFRRYTVKDYTFEEQANRNTIPVDIIPLLKSMISIGVNVAFTGAVRTAKTTFLQTWQRYEDKSLEGILIQTDPEIRIDELMPNAPIVSIVADGKELKNIIKPMLRSDGDYVILAEARDGIALDIGLKVCNKGTKRVKITYHTTDTIDFCYDVADEIVKTYGGSHYSHIIKVAKSFDYIFQFIQLKDKSQKRLKAIYEIRYNSKDNGVLLIRICEYDLLKHRWYFKYDIGEEIIALGMEEDMDALNVMKEELLSLQRKYPMVNNHVFNTNYDHLIN